MIDLTEKTAKALYGLLKELYQSRTAKDFVDVYGREERGKHGLDESRCLHEQRHFAQAAPVNRNEERNKAFMALKTGDVYRDIFGNRYVVFGVHDSSTDGKQVKEPVVVMAKADDHTPFSVPLEDFMNPTLKKV